MEYASEGKFRLDDAISEQIKRCFEHITRLFPQGQAFRFWRSGKSQGQFSANLFDIVSYGIYKNIEKLSLNPEFTAVQIAKLHEKDVLKELTGAGSNTKRKYLGRLELGERWFKAVN